MLGDLATYYVARYSVGLVSTPVLAHHVIVCYPAIEPVWIKPSLFSSHRVSRARSYNNDPGRMPYKCKVAAVRGYTGGVCD